MVVKSLQNAKLRMVLETVIVKTASKEMDKSVLEVGCCLKGN